MSLIENLKASGFKLEANTDGEFKPLKGTYKNIVHSLRPEIDQKNGNAKYYFLELKPSEVIEGDAFGERFTFKKRYYVDGDKAAENLKEMLNALFTAGIELDMSSDAAMEADFANVIGKPVYTRAWGWLPEGAEQPRQMFNVIKGKVAEKKRTATSLAF